MRTEIRVSRRGFLAGAAGVLLLAACGGEYEADFTVSLERMNQFSPASLTVPAGALVAWYHRGDHVHTVTSDREVSAFPERVMVPEGAQAWDSGNLYSGERWLYHFTQPGTYLYFCRYHERDGMVGTIVVV